MKLTTVLVLALPALSTATPILSGLISGLGSLLGAPKLPNQTGSLITLPLLPGAGFSRPNSCKCNAVGTFCGYRAFVNPIGGGPKPIESVDGGSCDPLGVYTCNQVDEFGSSGTCVLCLASLTGGREQVGRDSCAIRLADESVNN